MTEPDRYADRSIPPLHRRHPVALAVTLLVVVGALAGPSALATPTGATPDAALEVGWGYVLMAPVANVLDTLSVLTLGQHYAVLATLILVYAAWRVFRRRRRLAWLRRAGVEVGVAILSLAGLAAFYGYGMVGPRPMAAIAPASEDVIVVDVHSHTDHSHDARSGFTAEDNRAWHADAGFDAVYVSDHRNWRGWQDAMPGNPERAGDGTTLLPALEIKWQTKYASALGEPERYRPAVEGNTLIPDSMYALLARGMPRPTLVLTIPEQLDAVPPSTGDSIGFVAIEVSDASPRGLEQSRRDRALILRMVDSLDLAPVAATNNHGWGRTAAAWTLMPLPGWRDLSPRGLGAAIEDRFHRERRNASWVVERQSPYLGHSPAALAVTAPAIAWQMFGGMGVAERLSWLVWVWLVALTAPLLRARAAGRRRA
ncbi:MAG: hypothetical protein R6U63_01190 [Longimicrobiales bacterium]